MDYCPECSREVSDSKAFCAGCGSPLTSTPGAPGSERSAYRPTQQQPQPQYVEPTPSVHAQKASRNNAGQDESVIGTKHTKKPSSFKLLMIAGLMTFVCFGIIGVLVVLFESEFFSKNLLNEEPSWTSHLALQRISARELKKSKDALQPDKVQAWRLFFESNAVEHLRKSSVDYCLDVNRFHSADLWPDSLVDVISKCDEIKQEQLDYSKANAPYWEATSDIRKNEKLLEEGKFELSNAQARIASEEGRLIHVEVFIHGLLNKDENIYEVSEVTRGQFGGKRYSLRSFDTVFKTTGRTTIYLTHKGQTSVTLMNGNVATWEMFYEADTTLLQYSRRQSYEALQKVRSAESAISIASRVKPIVRTPYDARIERINVAIQEIVKNVSRTTSSSPVVTSVAEAVTSTTKQAHVISKYPSNNNMQRTVFTPTPDASECRRMRIGGSLHLLCTDTFVGQGVEETLIELITLGNLGKTLLVRLEDKENTCDFSGRFSQALDSIVVADFDNDGRADLALLISSKHGKYVRGKAQVMDCDAVDEQRVLVSNLREARLFKIVDMKPVPMSADLTKITHERVRAYMRN